MWPSWGVGVWTSLGVCGLAGVWVCGLAGGGCGYGLAGVGCGLAVLNSWWVWTNVSRVMFYFYLALWTSG